MDSWYFSSIFSIDVKFLEFAETINEIIIKENGISLNYSLLECIFLSAFF